MGVYAHSRGADERGASCRAFDHCEHPQGRRSPTTWRAADGLEPRSCERTGRPSLAADFFTTEVWTGRGLVMYYAVFVIELHTRRVQVLGATQYPDEALYSRRCVT